jgi:hypothetical protein
MNTVNDKINNLYFESYKQYSLHEIKILEFYSAFYKLKKYNI